MMRSIIKGVCRALYRLGFWHGLLAAERALGWRRHAVVLLYHHIRADDEVRLPLSQVEEGVSQSMLGIQLDAFCRWYRPCKPAELHAALAGKSPLREDALVVTFDDGYRDNRTLAAPLLMSHEVQGLIFVATGYIGSAERFWWVQLNDIVRSLNGKTLSRVSAACNGSTCMSTALRMADLSSGEQRRQLRMHLASALEVLPDEERRAELALLGDAVGGSTESCLPLLTWEEMRVMPSEGFEVGAHTVTHPHMSRLCDERLATETRGCAETLEREMGVRARAFAYPYGDFDGRVEKFVKNAGYEAAYTARPGTATPGKTSSYRIPRIQLHASEPAQLALLIVALKVSKYLPGFMRPLLSRLVDEDFEV